MTATHREEDAAETLAPVDTAVTGWTAKRVIATVVVGLCVGALLNAESLLAVAQRQPFGWQRDVAVALATPLADVSRVLGIDRARHVIDLALGRRDGEGDVPPPDDFAAPDPDPAPDAGSGSSAGPTPRDLSLLRDVPQSEDDAAGPERRRPITADDPLTMYVGGDSMVGQFGMAMEILGNETGLIATTDVLYEFGSGLSRPDFIDWPEVLAGVTDEHDPDVIVLYFGGNDAQPLELDGTVYEPEDSEWQQEYRTRVADLMDQLGEAGHHVYWMGLPIPLSDTMVRRFTILNGIYESEAEERQAVSFVPSWDLFAGPDGTYSEYLEDDDGELVDMRLNDGIHYTTAGAFRIARVAIAQMIDDFDIEVADD